MKPGGKQVARDGNAGDAYISPMSAALKLPDHRMTVEQFLAWDRGEGDPDRWILRDGVPEMMGTPSQAHAAIQAELGRMTGNALAERGSPCRVMTAGGVIPAFGRATNMLSPDLAVTCDPPGPEHAIPNPVVLIEILSPSNARETRLTLPAFATIPSVRDIVVLESERIAAEVFRRDAAGNWGPPVETLGAEDVLRLDSIGFAAPLRAAYRTAGLA